LSKTFLKVSIVLCKYIIIWRSNGAFKCKAYSAHHSNQQQLTCNDLQIRMYTIQCNTLISNRRACFSIISPKRIRVEIIISLLCRPSSQAKWSRHFRVVTFRNRLPKSLKSTKGNAKCLYTSNWIGPSLMCQNFSRRNIQKHYYKQKQNSQCSYINLLL
jgi:hypothetical protein